MGTVLYLEILLFDLIDTVSVYVGMEIKTLRSFIAVAEMQSFSAAARKLNTVQPAISRHIAELEEEVGVSLFWRNTREVKITAAGESLLVDAYEILEREEKAKDQARRAGRGETGRLRIGFLGPACLSFIPMLVQEFSNLYPDVRVHLFEMTVAQQLEALKSGKIDVAFSRPLANAKGLKINAVDVYQDVLTAAVPSGHPLANSSSIRLTQLANERFVLFNRGEAQGLYAQILHACHAQDFTPDVQSQPKTMQTVLTEVASGLGVSIVPGCVHRLCSTDCSFLPIKGQELPVLLELHSIADVPSPTVKAFTKLVVLHKQTIRNLVFPHTP